MQADPFGICFLLPLGKSREKYLFLSRCDLGDFGREDIQIFCPDKTSRWLGPDQFTGFLGNL